MVPEDVDDLWVLYNVVRPGDRVSARTTREIKREQEGARPTRGERVSIVLTLLVEKTVFQQGGDRLRVSGVVLEAPEKFGLVGNHHTVSLQPTQKLTLMKEEWSKFDMESVERAAKERYPPMVVVALDDDEGSVVLLRQHGLSVVGEIHARLPGKLDAERRDEAVAKYYASLLDVLEQAWNKGRGFIAIVGPGFWKEVFERYVRDHRPELAKNVAAVAMASSGGVHGVEEALRSGVLGKVVERTRVSVETEAVEKVLARLGGQKEGVSYGLGSVEKAISYGAVEELLVTDKMLRESANEERKILEGLMREVERMGGKILIVHAEHEAGYKLTSLGGIAGLLRFPIE